MRASFCFVAALVVFLSSSTLFGDTTAWAAEPSPTAPSATTPPPTPPPTAPPPTSSSPPAPAKPVAATTPATPAVPTKPRVLVLDVVSDELTSSERATLTNIVAAHLGDDPRLDVLSGDDIKQLVALQGQAQEVGVAGNCINDACLAELAGALGAGMVVSTRAGKLGDTIVVTLAIFDAMKAKSVARELVNVSSLGELPAKLGPALDELVVPLVKGKPSSASPATSLATPTVTTPTTTSPTTMSPRGDAATSSPSTAQGTTSARVAQLYDTQAAQICVTKEDASVWYFCNRVSALTENEFVRRYAELTGNSDLAAHHANRDPEQVSNIAIGGIMTGLGLTGTTLALCANTALCGDVSTSLAPASEPALGAGVLGGLFLILGGIPLGMGVFSASDGIPQDHTMSEREGRAAVDRYNAALMKKLRRDLGE